MKPLQSHFIILLVATAVPLAMPQTVLAHEGHAALPSTGAIVDGDQLLLSPAAIDAIGMKTEKIKFGDIRHTLRVNARVELPWSRHAKVTSLTAGKIQQVFIKPGEPVRPGQVLARIESLELETLQTEFLQTAAEVDLLKRLADQRRQLSARGGIAGKLLLQTETELQQKTAQYDIVHRKLHALGLSHDTLKRVKTTGKTVAWIPVVSPIAGTVEKIDAQPGQLVGATEHLFEIVDLTDLYVVGEVLEADAFRLKDDLRKDMTVTMTFAGLPNREFKSKISHVRLKMDNAKRTLHAVVEMNNRKGSPSQGLLRPGMFGRMSIEVEAATQAKLCPTSALIETPQGVYVLRDDGNGKFTRCPITIGLRSRESVVVKSGLYAGQQVVTVGTRLLAAMFKTDGKRTANIEQYESSGSVRSASIASSKTKADHIVLAATATVETPTSQKAVATSLIEGRVAKIFVKPGQSVQAGDVLAEVESQQLRNLQLDLLKSAGKMQWTGDEVKRLRALADTRVTLAREFWRREVEYVTLRQRVGSLERRLSLIGLPAENIKRLRLGKLSASETEMPATGLIPIRAPIGGRIADIGLTLGQIVHSDDGLFEIQNMETVWVKALVLERDASRIKVGQKVTVTFPADPNLHTTGKVVRIAPQLISRERVLPVWIEAPNPSGFLKDGMLARVEIKVAALSSIQASIPPASITPAHNAAEE